MEEVEVICEYLTEGEWFQNNHDEIVMSVGCDTVGVSVNPNSVVVNGHEKYGDGQDPYALSPKEHIADLNHDTQVSGEGQVVYHDTPDGEPLKLPKHLYFEEVREFPQKATTIEELEDNISEVLNISFDLDEVVSLAEEQGEI